MYVYIYKREREKEIETEQGRTELASSDGRTLLSRRHDVREPDLSGFGTRDGDGGGGGRDSGSTAAACAAAASEMASRDEATEQERGRETGLARTRQGGSADQ